MESLKEKLAIIWQTQKGFIIGIGACFVFIAILLSLLFFVKPPNTLQPNSQTNQQNSQDTIPQVYFQTYTNHANLPAVPQTVNTYSFKTDWSQTEIQDFAKKVGLPTVKTTSTDFDTISNFAPGNIGYGTFNKVTGTFSVLFYSEHKPSNYIKGVNPQSEALQYLQQIGITDKNISCPIMYNKTIPSTQGILYVECHRDWNKLGLPEYSYIGMLNTTDSSKLSSAVLGAIDANSPIDTSITNVQRTDGLPLSTDDISANGKKRPTDFNSITVGIAPDGRIVSIDSTMRTITNAKQQTSQTLLTSQQALNAFMNHKAVYSLTLPAGNGYTDLTTVYQNNQANSDNATITDYTLTYLEAPTTVKQKQLIPYYVIKGNATLTSGYTVNFVQVVPAIKSGNKLSYSQATRDVAGANISPTLPQKSLQIQTFTPTIYPTPTLTTQQNVVPQPPTTQPTPGPALSTCQNLHNTGKTLTIYIPGIGHLTVVVDEEHAGIATIQYTHTYYYKSADYQVADPTALKQQFFSAIEQQYEINVAKQIQQNASLTNGNPMNSVDDVYNLFKKIDGSGISIAIPTNNPPVPCVDTELVNEKGINFNDPNTLPHPAPRADCLNVNTQNVKYPNTYGTSTYDFTNANAVTKKVAENILQAYKNNSITSLANQTDIFPATTNNFGFDWLFADLSSSINGSPIANCYITGNSPAIFSYGNNQPVTFSLPETTYTYPLTYNHQWNTQLVDNKFVVNNQTHPYLYYEYNGSVVNFNVHREGFVTSTNKLEQLTKLIAKQFGLNTQETDRLIIEVKNATLNVHSPYVKVSIANQEEVNQKLPLLISPTPNHLYRIELLLTPEDQHLQVIEPILNKIERTGFTVIEVGARTE